MRTSKHIILPLVLGALLLAATGASAKLYIDNQSTGAALESVLESAQVELDAAQGSLTALEQLLAGAEAERDDCAARLTALENKLSGAEDDALLLEGEREELAEEIRLLRVTLTEKEAAISALEADIAQYNQVYAIDVVKQADQIQKILTALEEGAPLRKIAKFDKEGNEVEPPEDREVVSEDDEYYYIYPRLALYYEDLSTGYRLAYGEDETFFSASLIKAPYVLWLLEEVSREEDAARERAAAQAADEEQSMKAVESVETGEVDEAGGDSAVDEAETAERPTMIFEDERYDLSRTFVYTKDNYREGSGIIQNAEEGTEYTYRELVELAIRKSDNVAFGELREVFGYSDFYAFNTRLGVNSVRKRFNDITAADMAKYLREMYTFIETDENYGAVFKDWLCNSAHSVMIPYAVYPTTTAHKYGWDEEAYHDAAIVYDEHPYLLVILSDLDDGGTEVDTYIRSVVKLVNTLHKQFYQ